jgi:hypothetical protein
MRCIPFFQSNEVVMKSRFFLALPLASLIMLRPAAVMSQNTSAPSAPVSSADAGGQASAPFGFDDLMTLLVQPRHIKLYFAGTGKNWELAAAESRDLRSAFARIAQSIPKYLNNGVDETLKAMIVPKMQALDAAIAAADSKRFAASYDDLTAACNACHVYMEHPFIAVKVPEPSASLGYSDQEFRAMP